MTEVTVTFTEHEVKALLGVTYHMGASYPMGYIDDLASAITKIKAMYITEKDTQRWAREARESLGLADNEGMKPIR